MLGSGPDDGDFIELGPEKARRTWPIGGRTRRVLAVTGACALLVAGAAFAAVRLSVSGPANRALAQLITEVTTVPVSETVPAPAPTGSEEAAIPASGNPDTQSPPSFSGSASFVASGSASTLMTDPSVPTAVTGPPLTSGGQPELLVIATGYCPYCVAETWALIVALSRFGEFSGLSTSRSAAFENVPPIDGWTFYRSSYSSRYLTFVPVETVSNVQINPETGPVAGSAGYRERQRLTPAEQAVFTRLDQAQTTPFLDFGGRAVQIGTDVSPLALAHLTWSQIAVALRRPGSAAGRTILASAGTLTAELCRLTGGAPAAACAR